jgi:glycosyltransferase involved in cell wall biosynthesis
MLIVGGESEAPDFDLTPELRRLSAVAQSAGVADQVVFVGRRDRPALKYLYSAADVFLSTPWYEPFGLTPLESMACGTPVIGSCVGGIQYTVREGETGFLVPPDNPDAIAERVAQLYAQPGLLQRFGENAVEHVQRRFKWGNVAQQIETVYQQLVGVPA